MTESGKIKQASSSESSAFFEELIHSIATDQLTYQTETMHPEKKEVYDCMINNQPLELAISLRKQVTPFIIRDIFMKYVDSIQSILRDGLNTIAFNLTESKIFVWANIKNDREDVEDVLILAEAKTNASHSENGFRVFTTIVEESDNLEVPSNFTQVPLPK